jgi:glycosyltransferase involved in cell wall biosynthesis
MEGRLSNLQSWVLQCDSRFQLVFVCDSSTDETITELRAIQALAKNTKIEILEGNFGSPGSARNAGLDQAKNEWVTFWDSDDIGLPLSLIQEISRVDSGVVDGVVFGYQVNSGSEISKPWENWPLNENSCVNLISLNPGIWRFCFKKSSINELKFPNISMGEDQLFISDYMDSSPILSYSNTVVYFYHIDVPNQLTANKHALRDLSAANKIFLIKLKGSGSKKEFTIRMFTKVLLTQIRKSQSSAKIMAVRNLLFHLCRYPRVVMKLMVELAFRGLA